MVQAVEAKRPVEEALPNSHRSGESMSPEEKEQEKARLQALVKLFVQEAMQGMDCIIVDPKTGNRNQSRYVLDKSLGEIKFSINPQAILDLAQLEEVVVASDISGGPPAGLRLSTAEEGR